MGPVKVESRQSDASVQNARKGIKQSFFVDVLHLRRMRCKKTEININYDRRITF